MRPLVRCLAIAALAWACAAPARAPETICVPGPWVLSFEPGSSALDRRNRLILDGIAKQSPKCGDAPFVIEGYQGEGEPASLRDARTMAVFRYVIDRGVDPALIRLRHNPSRHPDRFEGRERHVEILRTG